MEPSLPHLMGSHGHQGHLELQINLMKAPTEMVYLLLLVFQVQSTVPLMELHGLQGHLELILH